MSGQLAMDFSAPPAKSRRPAPRGTTWKAYVEHVARYRTCIRLDLGRAWACEVPWQPGDASFCERMGPERRPCPLCEVRRELLEIITRGVHAEMSAEAQRVEAQSYREWLEADIALMRKVAQAEAGALGSLARAGTTVTALMLLREHGSVEAALEDLEDDAYAMDNDFFDVVRLELRLMSSSKRDVGQRRLELLRQEAA